MFQNVSAYLRNQAEKHFLVFEELEKMKYQKKPMYPANVIRYALLLLSAFERISITISLFMKLVLVILTHCNLDNCYLKMVKCHKDVCIIFDEMFLQKCAEYSGGTITGVNNIGELY